MVGQLEYVLIPSLISSLSNTFTLPNLTPTLFNISTTLAENPHIGNTGVPFMKSITSFELISFSIF